MWRSSWRPGLYFLLCMKYLSLSPIGAMFSAWQESLRYHLIWFWGCQDLRVVDCLKLAEWFMAQELWFSISWSFCETDSVCAPEPPWTLPSLCNKMYSKYAQWGLVLCECMCFEFVLHLELAWSFCCCSAQMFTCHMLCKCSSVHITVVNMASLWWNQRLMFTFKIQWKWLALGNISSSHCDSISHGLRCFEAAAWELESKPSIDGNAAEQARRSLTSWLLQFKTVWFHGEGLLLKRERTLCESECDWQERATGHLQAETGDKQINLKFGNHQW